MTLVCGLLKWLCEAWIISWLWAQFYLGRLETRGIETVHLRLGLQLMCGHSNPDRTQFRTQTHVAKTWTQPKPTVFQLRSHTWFQGLMKLRCLMSYHRKNPVRDKEIGKKWICLERSTPHRQSVGPRRGWVGLWDVAWLVFIDWVISYANE